MTLHYRGWPLMAHATAAKAGVDALTRTLALEWAPDRITVNAVAPGPIPTEGVKKAFTPAGTEAPDLFGMEKYAAESIPLGRWGTPADIGQMVTYSGQPRGDWITGAIMVVDGERGLEAGQQGRGAAGRREARAARPRGRTSENSHLDTEPDFQQVGSVSPLTGAVMRIGTLALYSAPLPRCPAAPPCS